VLLLQVFEYDAITASYQVVQAVQLCTRAAGCYLRLLQQGFHTAATFSHDQI